MSDGGIRVIENKIVILGPTCVGKTSLLNQYVREQFTGTTTNTIGAAFYKKNILIDDKYKVSLQIWDTAGQERFRSMLPMYYKGAHAAVLVHDVTEPSTLEQLQEWVEELRQKGTQDMLLSIASNKSDLMQKSNTQAAQEYAKTINATVFETSAKTGRGIHELFDNLARALVKKELDRMQQQGGAGMNGKGGIRFNNAEPPKKGGCC